jgi:hypothetical protein
MSVRRDIRQPAGDRGARPPRLLRQPQAGRAPDEGERHRRHHRAALGKDDPAGRKGIQAARSHRRDFSPGEPNKKILRRHHLHPDRRGLALHGFGPRHRKSAPGRLGDGGSHAHRARHPSTRAGVRSAGLHGRGDPFTQITAASTSRATTGTSATASASPSQPALSGHVGTTLSAKAGSPPSRPS